MPPKWCAIRIDESHHWAPSVVRMGRRIFGVYLVDLNARTYACSAQASYALHYVTSYPEVVPDVPESASDLAEFVEEQGSWTERVTYMGCSEIDAKIGDESIKVERMDTPEDWRDTEDRGFESVLEEYQANPRF